MEGGAEIGTQGWVKYRFNEPEQAQIATSLAHFAVFAGIGRKTAMGMGQACLGGERSSRERGAGEKNKPKSKI